MLRKISLMYIPLCLILLALLSACGAPVNGNPSTTTSGVNPTTTVPTTTATEQPTSVPATTTLGLTQQYAFTAQDNGKTITYGITTRFSLSLDQQHYPSQNLQLSCQAQNALSAISNAPYAAPPLYAVGYETIAAGNCTIQNGNFILTVIVIDPTTPTATSTPSPATPTAQPQSWNIYQDQAATFTLRYPAGWFVNVTPSGLAGSYEEIDFRPTPTSMVAFMVNVLYNGKMSPDTLLHNDPFYQSCTISSQSKITINGMVWSTASGMTKGPQVEPSSVTLAYANDKRPYRIEFIAPPDQFAAYSQTFNTMFQSFQER
jgi:hypothetical protein